MGTESGSRRTAGSLQNDRHIRPLGMEPAEHGPVVHSSFTKRKMKRCLALPAEILQMDGGHPVAEKIHAAMHHAGRIMMVAGIDQIHGIKNHLEVRRWNGIQQIRHALGSVEHVPADAFDADTDAAGFRF